MTGSEIERGGGSVLRRGGGRRWVSAVVAGCVSIAALWSAGPAAANSLGYTIYNFSGQTFRLAEIRGETPAKPAVFEHGNPNVPKVNDLLRPGGRLHVELENEAGNGARLLWRRVESQTAQTDVAIHLSGDARNENGSHFSQCSTTSSFSCVDQTEWIGIRDRADTVRSISAEDPNQQAEILGAFCRPGGSSRLRCGTRSAISRAASGPSTGTPMRSPRLGRSDRRSSTAERRRESWRDGRSVSGSRSTAASRSTRPQVLTRAT